MEEKKICKACGEDKVVTDYHIYTKMKSGRANVCKKCVANGKRIKEPNTSSRTTQERRARLNENPMKMCLVTKEEYLLMYEFMRLCGYDTDKDVHEQFLEKWNAQIDGKPMRKRKRSANSVNAYLSNGERNPENKRYDYAQKRKKKQTPTD